MGGTVRIAIRIAAIALSLAAGIILFYLWNLVGAANPWPRRFLGGVARIIGVRITTRGQPAPGRLLMLANHVSWIDVPALAGTTGTAFVAHDGLAGAPLVKWLCDLNDTIFVARHDRTTVGVQVESLRRALSGKSRITIFPETTTSDGTSLLPFKSSLLAALDPLAAGVSVQPVWLDYGQCAPEIAWIGNEPGLNNFKRILARPPPLALTVHFLEPLGADALADRKSMAAAARAAIARAMTGTSDHAPA